jgi:signal transduction histidine kinase
MLQIGNRGAQKWHRVGAVGDFSRPCRFPAEEATVSRDSPKQAQPDPALAAHAASSAPAVQDRAASFNFGPADCLTPASPPCEDLRKTARFVALLEAERQHVATEIHDGVAQYLASALMFLESSQRKRTCTAARRQSYIETGIEILQLAVAESRRLVDRLLPPQLDSHGLDVLLDKLVAQHVEPDGFRVEVVKKSELGRLATRVEYSAYRIMQELLTLARHNKARAARITVWRSQGWLNVEVEDWGSPAHGDATPADDQQMQSIRLRVELLGGQIQTNAIPMRGSCTSVSLRVDERPC